MLKRVISCLMTVLLLVSLLSVGARAAGTEVSITPPATLPAVGESFTVTVDLSGNPGVAAAQFTLQFDPAVVDCKQVSTGTVLSGMLNATNPDAADGAIVAAASTTESKKDGTMATYVFTVVGSGDPKFGMADLVLSNAAGDDISCTVKNSVTGEPIQPSPDPTPAPKPEQKPAENPSTAEKPTRPEETPVEHKFSDTADHPLELLINAAVERGYFEGYSDGTFRPDGRVTRGAFVTVLWRMAGKPQPTVTTPFTDIGALSAEFRQAIAWAYGKGYINGRTATTFAPSDPVSRQAALKIVFNYAGGVSGQEVLFTQIYDSTFTDSGTMADWARAPMYWGIYNELIDGTTKTTLGPAVPATRAELARILVGYVDRFE